MVSNWLFTLVMLWPIVFRPFSGTHGDIFTVQQQVVNILFPRPGQVLQGKIAIQATTTAAAIKSAGLLFGYQDDPTGTWFLLWEWPGQNPPEPDQEQPFLKPQIYEWDTTTLTDGDYTLKLVVTLEDGSQAEATVPKLRVRNYTPIETSSPSGESANQAITPTDNPALLTPTVQPSPEPQPTNPAQLTPAQIGDSMRLAVIWVFAVFLLMGIYIYLRSISRQR
jgi:hypothetical protein